MPPDIPNGVSKFVRLHEMSPPTVYVLAKDDNGYGGGDLNGPSLCLFSILTIMDIRYSAAIGMGSTPVNLMPQSWTFNGKI